MNDRNHTQTAECRLAVERLLDYLEEPRLHRAALDAAIEHMRECPYCESGVEYLIRALATGEEDQLTCVECQDLLPEYLRAEMEGRVHEERWQPVALHLETCPHCAAVYASLHDLAALAEGMQGIEPSHYPTPDLSFLRARRVTMPSLPNIPWRLEASRLIVEFSAELVRALRSSARQTAYAAAGLKSAKSRRILCQLSLKEAVEDLEVVITAEERRDDPARCMIIVEVNVPSKGGWPNLAGSKVTLRRGEEELETQWTGAFGEAVFQDVNSDDLSALVFEIAPPAE